MALRQGLEALSTGLLRQVAIGGRAYEDASIKEGERRAETRQVAAERRALRAAEEAEKRADREWERRQKISAGTASAAAAALAETTAARLGTQIESTEKLGLLGLTSRKDIAQMGITSAQLITSMNITSAEGQNNGRIAAQKFLQNERLSFQEGESVLDREAQKVNTDTLIAGRENVAQMTLDARWSELALARQWHMDDAISAATSTKQKQAYEAKVKQAESEESGLAKLYGELGTEGLDETRRDEILNLIYAAQDRVAAAWRATGIAPLMSDKHIKESQWKFLAKNIVGAIAIEYRNQPEAWEDLIISLHGKKDSSAYKKSVEGITPTINTAIDDSLLRGGPKDKSDLKKLVISYLANYRATELSGGYGETGAPWKLDKTLNKGATDKGNGEMGEPESMALSDTSAKELMATLSLDVERDELPALMESANVAISEAEARATEIEKYIHSYLRTKGLNIDIDSVRSYITTGMNLRNMDTGEVAPLSPEIKEYLTMYTDAWKKNDLLRGQIKAQIGRIKRRTEAKGMTAVDDTPRGMLNEGGRGMIAAVDQGITPQELAKWEPEAVEARRVV